MLRMAFTSCYSPLLLLPVSFRKSFVPPPSPLPVPCPPFFAFKYSVVVYKKRLITLETQWNAAYCSTAALSKIITAVGNNNVCLLVRFSGDVGCVLRPHGRAIVAGRRLPSGAGTKTKKLFFPLLIPSNWVDRFIGFLLSGCQLIVLQWFKLWHWWDSQCCALDCLGKWD